MMRKLLTGVVSASLVMSMMAPVALADDLTGADNEISGNGPRSNNVIIDVTKNVTVVDQSNHSGVVTLVSSSASTGGNEIKNGDGSIDTGSALSVVVTKVGGPSNEATVAGCGCPEDEGNLISGNGPRSNSLIVDVDKNVKVTHQTNYSFVFTGVSSHAKTGGNEIKNGDGSITTRRAISVVVTKVKAPKNVVN